MFNFIRALKLNSVSVTRAECEDAFCPHSHQAVAYDRAELARLGAYIVYADFMHFVSVIFDPKFLWQYEAYIQALYEAYGVDRVITVRHVRRFQCFLKSSLCLMIFF